MHPHTSLVYQLSTACILLFAPITINIHLTNCPAPAAHSVVFDGRDLVGVDETTPYTARPMDYYTQTKVAGERLALAAAGPDLGVVALRPSGIFGEGDTVMVPTFVRQARAGKMKYIIGSGTNVWDFTYVGNVAQAHVLVRQTFACLSVGEPPPPPP